MADIESAITQTKIKTQQRHRALVKHGFRELLTARLRRVDQQRLVITVLTLPSFNRIGADALATNRQTRHIVWRINRKKQHKRDEIHANQDGHAVKQASHEVARHGCPSSLSSNAVRQA